MAPICKFWVKGQCRFGSSCKFDHPPRETLRNDNRFAALQPSESGPSNNHAASQADTSTNRAQQMRKYLLNKESIQADLSTECPQWLLSAYGPGQRSPIQLFGGPEREQSFEEMRMRLYEARAHNNPAPAIQTEDELVRQARMQMQNILNNVDAAIDYVLNGENEHPNRIDICQDSRLSSSIQANGFAIPDRGNAFSSPIAAPAQAFSQPQSQPTLTSSSPGTVFGQLSGQGQNQNPFDRGGADAGSGMNGSLVSVNQFGGSQGQNAFGTTPPNVLPNPFSRNQQQGEGGAFGRPVQQPILNTSFTSASNSSTNFPPTSTSSTTSNPLTISQPPPNPFRAQEPSFAGSPQQREANIFQQSSSNVPAQTNLFASNSTMQSAPTTLNGTIQNGTPSSNGTSQHPQLTSYASVDSQRQLTMFQGRPVVYKDGEAGIQNRDGSWEKIWFPEGQPSFYKDTEVDDEKYDEALKGAYAHVRETGSFEHGIPLVPPKREWCRWDF